MTATAVNADIACDLRRPPRGGVRRLFRVQTWDAPCGCTGEAFVERHGGHRHLWIRWGGVWSQEMEPEHWDHFRAHVRPILRDAVLEGCCLPLDRASRELLGEVSQ